MGALVPPHGNDDDQKVDYAPELRTEACTPRREALRLIRENKMLTALGDDLTRLVLHYTWYRRDARDKLADDPALMYFYYCHTDGFVHPQPGVWVDGAGDNDVNGFYRRREASEGPPRCYPNSGLHSWTRDNRGSHWYEKDDGSGCWIFLCQDGNQAAWRIHVPTSETRFFFHA